MGSILRITEGSLAPVDCLSGDDNPCTRQMAVSYTHLDVYKRQALSADNAGEIEAMGDNLVTSQAIDQYGNTEELKGYDKIGTKYYDLNCSREYLSLSLIHILLPAVYGRTGTADRGRDAGRRRPPNCFSCIDFPYGIQV